jgi:hypothetical protein
MTDDTPLPFDLPAVRRRKLTVDFDGGNQSSDAGLLLPRGAQAWRSPAARRDPDRIQHAMFEMVMARASAIVCGHKDAIDHDRLRHDPLMKIAVGRCPETGAPLASQSTMSRLENAPTAKMIGILGAVACEHNKATRPATLHKAKSRRKE